ncbi:MAG: copper transporter [Bacteroidetes bacterium HGW-Bacteroidetes-17]|jgi:multidrug efflux pump subunit AcrB|nr:MAG: copper transporter [Bacteroidetes bacterium HGW-Bacteroidetes-17]
MKENVEKVIREFKLTTLAIKNKNTVFLLTIALAAFGLFSYVQLPKELQPDISVPWILVTTVYPGNAPVDIENLISRPLEKEIETIKGIKKMTSTSAQDYSLVFIEFNTNVEISKALSDVKDAVDKAKSELPNDLDSDPVVDDIEMSEFPVININLSGDYSLIELKKYAEFLEEEIETINEVARVDITGINEREIKINVDMHKLASNQLNFDDIENAIAAENVSISGGEIKLGGTRRSIRTMGEFTSMKEIENIIIKNEDQNIVYLKDVAEVIDGFAEPNSFARLNKQPVVSLQIVKKSGENILATTDQVFEILDKAKNEHSLPANLNISITNDTSAMVRMQLSNLENSIILGMLFVIIVLFFFLGTRNALFVGFAIPMSMFLSFVILSLMGYRINMMVLFALILALGMLVDNAIVVVENIVRFNNKGYGMFRSAKDAVGEIAMPIISSTLTTLAAFFPLIFWDSIIGEFMKYLPITLVVVLTSSLFVALVIIPVFAATFNPIQQLKPSNKRKVNIRVLILMAIAAIFYAMGSYVIANLIVIGSMVTLFNVYYFKSKGQWFQDVGLPRLENFYLKVLQFALRKRNPYYFIGGTVVLLIFTLIILGLRQPKVLFFPDGQPKYINVLAELPIGSDITVSNELMSNLEDKVIEVLKPYGKVVESVLTNVGTGSNSEDDFMAVGETPHKGRITVTFVDYEYRDGLNTSELMKEVSDEIIGKYPGVLISVEKNSMGPPTGKPINIEISGKEFSKILALTDTIETFIEEAKIDGIEGFKIDLDIGKPEMIVHIDRDKARRFELSTAQIAMTLRTALFGKEISDYKVGEDEYPIQLRLMDKYRYNVPGLLNQKMTFRNNSGKIIQIPISALVSVDYSTTYGAVKRKNTDRVVTLYSNVIEGFNANEINIKIKERLKGFELPVGYQYSFTGEQEDQQESTSFLARALLIAMSLILIILVTQFNSVVKPLIILTSVLFSTIGVFGGIATFNMDIVIIMTGIGIVSLAGVVVNNAIVLVDYVDLLKRRKREELGMEEDAMLNPEQSIDCVVEGGKTRLRPVLLTAITTILGLIPMAIGMNINFNTLLTNFDPQFSIGGDMVTFWGPLSWTVIFGLTFATFLTLIVVPTMYHTAYMVKAKIKGII